MSGIFTALNTALSGLDAFSTSVNVVSDNISNANNENYAARRAEFEFQIAGGVRVSSIQREFDRALLRSTLTARASAGAEEVRKNFFDDFERKLGTSSGNTPLNDRLQTFINSWQSFEANPEIDAVRYDVVRNAGALVNELQRISTALDESDATINNQIRQDVADLNTALREFSRINGEVARVQGEGNDTAALENLREEQLHIIAKYVPVSVSQQSSGHQFLFGPTYSLVTLNPTQFTWNQTTETISRTDISEQNYNSRVTGGRLGAIINLVRSDNASVDNPDRSVGFVAKLRFQLDELARQLTDRSSATVRSDVQFQNLDVPLGNLAGTAQIANVAQAATNIISPGTISFNTTGNNLTFNSTTAAVFGGVSVSGAVGNQVTLNISAATTLNDLRSAINQVGGLSADLDSRGRLLIQSDIETAISVNAGATGLFGANVTQTLTPNDPPNFARAYNLAGFDATATFNIPPTATATSIIAPGGAGTLVTGGVNVGALNISQRDRNGNTVSTNTINITNTTTPAQLLTSLNAIDGITATYNAGNNLVINSSTGGVLEINPTTTGLYASTARYSPVNLAASTDVTGFVGVSAGIISFTTTPIEGGPAQTQTINVTVGQSGAQLISEINNLTDISAVQDAQGNIRITARTGANLVLNSGTTGLFGAAAPATQTFANTIRGDEERVDFFQRGTTTQPVSRNNILVASSLVNRTSTIKRSSGSAVNAAFSASTRAFDEAGFTQSNTDYARLATGWLNDVLAASRRVNEVSTTQTNILSEINTRYRAKVNVSLDAELARLTVLQNSYTAMTRVVNASDAMLRALEAVV
ncbi:MAG: flagellin hook IN motif-containing protein [Pseudomonadota bacterium]